jgi:Pyruvate/2-oxoacid:ferredoxin oxidoreductase delta subunit
MKAHSSQNEPLGSLLPFTVHLDRCLNDYYRAANCILCQDVCPVQAIEVHAGKAAVDSATCVNCGVCVQACPTEVFAESTSIEIQLVAEINRSNHDAVELVCPLALEISPSGEILVRSKLPLASCHASSRCLGALSTADLLELSQMGERSVSLNDSVCLDCPIGEVQEQILTIVRQANTWLANYGREPSVLTYSSLMSDDESGGILRHAILPPSPNTRRSFLRKALGLDQAKETTALTHVPKARQRLLAYLSKLEERSEALNTSGLPVTNVKIDADRCSACGLCAKFCPTGGIEFVADEEVFGVLFSAEACVDCGICALACPESAIAYADELPGGFSVDERPRRLASGFLEQCLRCNARLARSSIYTECFVCRQRRSRPSFLMTG